MAKTVSLQVIATRRYRPHRRQGRAQAGHVPGDPLRQDEGELRALAPDRDRCEEAAERAAFVDERERARGCGSDRREGAKVDQHLALLQDVQHHPLEDYIIHIDLHEIAQDEILHAEVPVASVGEPAGVKNGGGLLETMLRTIRVACLPRDLPDLYHGRCQPSRDWPVGARERIEACRRA